MAGQAVLGPLAVRSEHNQPTSSVVRERRVTDVEALGQMSIPDRETCVLISRSAVAALLATG